MTPSYRIPAPDEHAAARRARAYQRYERVFSLRNIFRAILLAIYTRVRKEPPPPPPSPPRPVPGDKPILVSPPAAVFRATCGTCAAVYEYRFAHIKGYDTHCPACGGRNMHVGARARVDTKETP